MSREKAQALQYGRPKKDDPRKTPAKPDERKKGSKRNPEDSASKPNSSIEVSADTEKKIRALMEEHNAKNPKFRANMAALKAVFRRGAGAFSSSHAPGMDRTRWGLNRIKAFLYLLRNGRPSNPNYKQDNDLLPSGHPRSTKDGAKGSRLDQFITELKQFLAGAEERYGGKPREELKDSDFVIPSERKFPIMTPQDVKDAISSFGRYKGGISYDEFVRKLYALCRRKGPEFVAAIPKATLDRIKK